MTKEKGGRTVQVVRWIAGAFSGLVAALILLIFIGNGLAEGIEPVLHLSVREALMMVAFVAVRLGLLARWKWELYGGSLTIFGMVAFYLVDYLFSGSFPRGLFYLFFSSPSLLFFYCGLQARKEPNGKNA